jgi:hypothetical protein
MQKSPIKNTLYFGKYKKDKFLIVNSSKIVYLFFQKFVFLYFPKYKLFLMRLLYAHASSVYIFLYI